MADDEPQASSSKAPPPTAEAIAVAVKQHDGPEQVPKVVAGGRSRVAEQILEIAFSQGIRVREDADLAQMLSVVDVESEIPLEAFATVAEILTYVYEANNAMSADRDRQSDDDKPPGSPSQAAEMAEMWALNKGYRDD